MLYTSGATQRLGRVDDGSATTDYDEEEISRKMSIAASMASVEWYKTKINLIDTPGFNMFVHEHVESGRIDQINLGLVPLHRRHTGRNRHLAGDFFFVVVGRR